MPTELTHPGIIRPDKGENVQIRPSGLLIPGTDTSSIAGGLIVSNQQPLQEAKADHREILLLPSIVRQSLLQERLESG